MQKSLDLENFTGILKFLYFYGVDAAYQLLVFIEDL